MSRVQDSMFVEPVLVVSINQSFPKRSVYDAARYAWRVSAERARSARYVIAVKNRRVVGVFEPCEWRVAIRANFPEFEQEFPGRVGFVGKVANEHALQRYLGRSLPAEFKFSGNGYRYAGPSPEANASAGLAEARAETRLARDGSARK